MKRKVFLTGTALVLCMVILLSGTFAWQSINQTALNETIGEANPGGRLHDDYDGENKDVYVENFTMENEGGVPILVRIRLFEYMEIGADAGVNRGAEDRKATPLIQGADIDNVATWNLHIPGADATADPFHEYWTWKMGGQTVYMPTFNKNKDSHDADINGTYEGSTPGDATHYDDNVIYTVGDAVTGEATYDADTDTDDEGDNAQLGIDINTKQETHTATVTLNAQIMSMEQWKANGSVLGDFWVYDTDGWAYWANPLWPETATGLLLDEVKLTKAPVEKWYYGIWVDSQMVTADDIGADNDTGFYDTKKGTVPTTDAEVLLEKLADAVQNN